MTIRRDGGPTVRATTRRLVTLGVAWAAASAISMAGCAHPATISAPSAAGSPSSAPSTAAGEPAAATTSAAPPVAVAPRASATTAPVARLSPVRISIPAIAVDASLVRLGLTADGALAVPTRAMTAGWYTGSPVPGRVGPAVIAGHVHWNGRPAVFTQLAKLAPGDRIVVSRSDGTTATFAVDRVASYPKDRFPTALVYGSLDVAGLRLITCGGFDPVAREYEANVIVFATLAAA